MLRRLYEYWRPARMPTLGGLALLAVAGALELMLPWPVKWLVDCVFGTRSPPAWMQTFWTHSRNDGDKSAWILLVAGAVLVLGIAHKLAFMTSNYLLIRAGLRLVRGIRCAATDHLHRLSLSYHDRAKVGDLVYRTLYDSYAAQSLLSQVVAPVLTGGIVLVGIILVMARVDPWMTVIAAVTIPAIATTVWAFGRRIERLSKRQHERESALFSVLQESLLSIRAVQAFRREDAVNRRFADEAARSEGANRRVAVTQLAFSAAVGTVMAGCTSAAVYVGAHRVTAGTLSVGDVLVFLSYLGMLYNPISAFAQSSGVMQSARTQLGRVFEILDVTPMIADRPGAVRPERVEGRIAFNAVHFGYGDGVEVLKGLDAVVEPGTAVAIVGRTGAGKSTIASLLLRFYDPTLGCVTLDGRDLRDLGLDWLRSNVGVVLQDAILFAGTVAENIALGRDGATREQIIQAARQAQAHDFIARLPDGYDTILGERGVNLSGGQRQRISIARAFLKNAPILILDEPTSALDTTPDFITSADPQLEQRKVSRFCSTLNRTAPSA